LTPSRTPHSPRSLSRLALLLLAIAGAALAWATAGASADGPVTVTFNPGATQTFTATGAEQQYVVPSGVSALHVVATGAPGGGATGGRAHQVTGDVAVTGGQTLFVEVGGLASGGTGGFNGGGDGGSGGGGASDIRTAARSAGLGTDTRLIVAGGGGGEGATSGADTPGAGGDAEAAGGTSSGFLSGGGGATGTTGGTGGSGGSACDPGTTGALGAGGNGGATNIPGGGGGGGLAGGGGGEAACSTAGGGGGGGSSLVPAGGTKALVATSTAPKVEITVAEYAFTVPAGVTTLHVVAVGGHGGNTGGTAGRGQLATTDIAVTPGERLYANVGGNGRDGVDGGQGGFNGGGDGNFAGGGGGASDLRTSSRVNGLAPDTRFLIAAGGGGEGSSGGGGTPGAGGDAESAGSDSSTGVSGGGPGTSGAGGAGGALGSACDAGSAGTLGDGGTGGPTPIPGGGGGGGLYGGGGGEAACSTSGGGGGGGSSLVPAGGSKVLAALSAAPKVDISYTPPATTTTGTGTGTTTTPTTPTTTQTVTTSTPAPFSVGTIRQGADGTLTLTLKVPAAGVLEALASYPKKSAGRAAALKLGKGRLLYARAKKTVTPGTVKVKLKPTAAAKRALKKRKLLVVKVVTRLTPKTGSPLTKTKTVKVRAKKTGSRAAARG
jgi:hypothetical protein